MILLCPGIQCVPSHSVKSKVLSSHGSSWSLHCCLYDLILYSPPLCLLLPYQASTLPVLLAEQADFHFRVLLVLPLEGLPLDTSLPWPSLILVSDQMSLYQRSIPASSHFCFPSWAFPSCNGSMLLYFKASSPPYMVSEYRSFACSLPSPGPTQKNAAY